MKILLYEQTHNISLREGQHGDGSLAIQAIEDDGSPFGVLTVCVPGTYLNENEILVKTWSENSEWVPQLLGHGFEDTGRRVKTGYVEAQIWKRTL